MKNRVIRFKLLTFPNCAICDNSEQYQDETFLCRYYYEDCDPYLTPQKMCDSWEFSDLYLMGYLELLTKIILDLKKEKGAIKK